MQKPNAGNAKNSGKSSKPLPKKGYGRGRERGKGKGKGKDSRAKGSDLFYMITDIQELEIEYAEHTIEEYILRDLE